MKRFALLVVMALGVVACEKQGPLQRAGEKVDEAVEDIGAGAETAGNKIDDAVDEAKKAAEDLVDDAK